MSSPGSCVVIYTQGQEAKVQKCNSPDYLSSKHIPGYILILRQTLRAGRGSHERLSTTHDLVVKATPELKNPQESDQAGTGLQ